MKRVYEYIISMETDYPVLSLPFGAEVLYVREQYENICLWALVDPKEEDRQLFPLRIVVTGQDIQDENLEYLGTAHLDKGSLIIHVFHDSD